MLERAIHLSRMLRAEWRKPESLLAAQDEAVRKLVRHTALRVPFYRDLYIQHGLDGSAFRGLEDLECLPVVDKHMLRSAGERVLADNPPAGLVRILTSGSTGEPYEFHIDRDHDQWRKAQYLRPYLNNGRRLHDRVLRLTAFPSERAPWFSSLGLLREWQMDCAAEPRSIVAKWRELKPTVLQGYPSSLFALAHHCLESGERLEPAPHRVFTDSEMLLPEASAAIERAFGVAPIDIFGTYETDNIAYQCGERRGYHVTLDSVILEILRDGRPVPAGQEGELVATVLTNRTHPFIRYRLGDIGRFASEKCPCGRTFPLLDVISGRADDMIELACGTRRTPLDVLGRLDGFVDYVRRYQLRQLAVDTFELWIVPTNGHSPAVVERILQALEAPLHRAKVTVHVVNAVPRDASGKLRSFINEMNRIR